MTLMDADMYNVCLLYIQCDCSFNLMVQAVTGNNFELQSSTSSFWTKFLARGSVEILKTGGGATLGMARTATQKVLTCTAQGLWDDALTGAAAIAIRRELQTTFQVGFRASLRSVTPMCVVGAYGGTALVEGLYLVWNVYKLWRKKKYGHISKVEFKRALCNEVVATCLAVPIIATSSILGQIIIPVPVLGAAVGGLTGSIISKLLKKIIRVIFEKVIKEKCLTLPQVVTGSFTDC